ncbi:8748_t:CDS:2 [Funneliformis mosseae]|uniref:8748_t:CDS:1 n=1 Tax=Funneliformis mosseae TaxID=27381 RepID=A0A9N8ZM05_FUNMO|nr:8748_t:CDS:2 [Funneliformis mosseae]
MVMMIPKVLPIPFPQQSSTSDSPFLPTDDKPDNDNVVAEPGRKNNILYWVFGIIGIAVFVEIIYWIFRFNRRRDLFDIPSYAGSIDEELPPYEGFSLPKYHHIINENISSNGGDQGSIASPQETIQMVGVTLMFGYLVPHVDHFQLAMQAVVTKLSIFRDSP